MKINNLVNKYMVQFSILFTFAVVILVNLFKIPNPNVILITVIVYLTFLGGFRAGILSGIIVILYSQYFFSCNHCFISYTSINLRKIIVIVIFIPILIIIVGTLHKQYNIKTKELELKNQRLDLLSKVDTLTNISNRRSFEEYMERQYIYAMFEKKPISVFIIDIDFFKQYNDYYGHIMGDSSLIKVAQCISKEVSKTDDFAARFGGEEFVVVLNDTGKGKAKWLAENVLNSIADLKIPHSASRVMPFLTVSIGVATQNDFETTHYQDLLVKADQALYQAKNNGRNQVIVFEES